MAPTEDAQRNEQTAAIDPATQSRSMVEDFETVFAWIQGGTPDANAALAPGRWTRENLVALRLGEGRADAIISNSYINATLHKGTGTGTVELATPGHGPRLASVARRIRRSAARRTPPAMGRDAFLALLDKARSVATIGCPCTPVDRDGNRLPAIVGGCYLHVACGDDTLAWVDADLRVHAVNVA